MTPHAFIVLTLAFWTQSKPAGGPLKIGDLAPPLQVSTWVPGQPPALPGPQVEGRDTVVVMHFWSVSDAASRRSFAHLAQLHADFAPRVVVIALSNEETEAVAGTAQRFKLPYWIASDDDNHTTEAWLTDVGAFPWTYVVDRGGRIVWRGDSMWELRQVITEILSGQYDLAEARKRIELDERAMERANICLGLPSNDPKAILRAADQVIAVDPTRTASYQFKRNLLLRMPGGADKLAKLNEKMRASMWNNVAGLHTLLAWQWEDTAMKYRDPAVMLRCAERIVELTKCENPFALAELARVQHELGRHDAAIENQSKAVELIKFDPEDEYTIVLEYYRRIKEAAAQPTASAPASAP